jgi:hypothetical protein
MWQRVKPAVLLVLLAPLIAEYLLGSLSFAQIGLFPIMALMYGTGAVFIRETVRRCGRGWPTMITLGIAYGVIEEGLATQSLFNPNYLGLRLLDRGFVPSLGIGAPWTIYVIMLHVVWSIAVPVGLVEAIFSERRSVPWLGNLGFAVSGIAFVLGVALVAFGTWNKEHFRASFAQLAATSLIAAMFSVAAFALFRPHQAPPAATSGQRPMKWRPAAFGLLALVTGSAFHIVTQFGARYLTASAQVAVGLLLPMLVIVALRLAIRSGEWSTAHTDALVLGGISAYCWLGFVLTARLHGSSSIPGQFFPLAIVLGVIYLGIVRKRKPKTG